MPVRAVVFAYHNVGVRGLATLLAHGVEVPLVVTHADNPAETIWFDSVAELAERERIPSIAPDQPNSADVSEYVRECAPDFIFSFYYRYLLKPPLLRIASRGAYNLHGSLLPRYRGRVPVNWAVLHGERETGASLHRMVARADAGAVVDQESVPVLPNDTAQQVFHKVTWAAEKVLDRSVPALVAGTAEERELDLAEGSYFGRRAPADGLIDWTQDAWRVHNLVRAVAPPYPGAFFDFAGERLCVLASHYRGEPARGERPRIYWEGGRCYADCVGGGRFQILDLRVGGERLDAAACKRRFGCGSLYPLTRQRKE